MCRSVSVLLCVDVIQSFTYVLRFIILGVIKRRGEAAREKATGYTNGLSRVPQRKEMKLKKGTSGCGSFFVAYFQPAISIDHIYRYCRVDKSSEATEDPLQQTNADLTDCTCKRQYESAGSAHLSRKLWLEQDRKLYRSKTTSVIPKKPTTHSMKPRMTQRCILGRDGAYP